VRVRELNWRHIVTRRIGSPDVTPTINRGNLLQARNEEEVVIITSATPNCWADYEVRVEDPAVLMSLMKYLRLAVGYPLAKIMDSYVPELRNA
jgi:hypothetical protein